jgi:S-adenosylmethionine:tRNA ribosyltransferase-isomerase
MNARQSSAPGAAHGHAQFQSWDIRAYAYDLPRDRIAQSPAAQRDASRLMTYDRASGVLQHRVFSDLPELLLPGDVLVVNDCRVMPARLWAQRIDTGTIVELLLTECLHDTTWRALAKPGRSCRPGVRVRIGEVQAEVDRCEPDGQRVLTFDCAPSELEELLAEHGAMPLPPYICRPRGSMSQIDKERYQTVYAARGAAVAAPTAGLHFTHALLARLDARGVGRVSVTLDVGLGTFQPVKTDDVRQHTMHAERFVMPETTADALNAARADGRRVIAVGTTALRVLETCIDDDGVYQPRAGVTSIFIHPPMLPRSIDALITNFHLPRSTLLMLVAAWTGGNEWRRLYAVAIAERYRFYSYGDAMLLW